MRLASGTQLGPYEVVAPIGAGGMGEVYSAVDTRLHRTVAVKVSTDQFTERFEREARAVAALNHPYICQIYDVGPNYLVMEYIDGRPLKGPLPLDEALKYAGQICDALDAAHRKSIVHRDLKPANILVTKSGVKLLDFGLAKIEPAVAAAEHTMTMALTGKGTILGTLHYMSPEQLQGRDADARSDIFAFGLVLYELLTGKRAFDGDSPASVIGAILERPAPSIADVAPASLDRVLHRCLTKDPDDRWQSARDLKAALAWTAESEPAETPKPRAWRGRAGWMAAAILAAAMLILVPWLARTSSTGELVRFPIYPPEGTAFTGALNATVHVPQFAVSPDGKTVAFAAAAGGGKPILWLRRLDQVTAHSLAGTEGATHPFWSPDGQTLGFHSDGQLKRLAASGGPVQIIAGAGNLVPRGGAWGPDDTILFSGDNFGIYRAALAGGPVTPVTGLASHIEGQHLWPRFLPDGRHFLFTVRGAEGHAGIHVGLLDGTLSKPLIGVDSGAVYASPGYLLWVDGGLLLGQGFDAASLELRGQPFNVAEGVGRSSAAQVAVSASSSAGTLAYSGPIAQRSRLTWFDRSGTPLHALSPEGDYTDFQLSPDGKRLAASLVNAKTGVPEIWLSDLERGGMSRLTTEPGLSASPVWSPDGSRLIYRGMRKGFVELFQRSASMGGNEELVLAGSEQAAVGVASNMVPTDWCRDSRYVIYALPAGATGLDLWLLRTGGGTPQEPKIARYLSSPSYETQGAFSPDCRLVAYTSDESGTNQVYVQTFPLSDHKWPISTAGGSEPRWRSDGHELYYLSDDKKLMAVSVGPSPTFGQPKPLFQTRVPGRGTYLRSHYAAAPDGQRFLVNTETGDSTPNPITVVLNWTAGLKK
jgi:Tol biopolymer transport system component/predicted Ser/Thr protein kinase